MSATTGRSGRHTAKRKCVRCSLTVGTINGAYASYEEQEKGSISIGKYADFVVQERDPHAVDPDRLKDIRMMRTVVGGRTVFEHT